VRQRARSRAVSIARQGTTERVGRATVLEKERSGYSGITGMHVNGRPMLRGAQENFRRPAILEAAHASRVPDAAVLELEQLVSTSVWETLARHVTLRIATTLQLLAVMV